MNEMKPEFVSDCIKVLYEIGFVHPELISSYATDFMNLVKSRNNRMVWGAMIALLTISLEKPDEIYSNIDLIIKTINNGSVITVDNGILVCKASIVENDGEPSHEASSCLSPWPT